MLKELTMCYERIKGEFYNVQRRSAAPDIKGNKDVLDLSGALTKGDNFAKEYTIASPGNRGN